MTARQVDRAETASGIAWLERLQADLGTEDAEQARVTLVATLHALRDHLPVHEAAQLGGCLPTLVRGLYYEGWNPSAPVAAGSGGYGQLDAVAARAVGRLLKERLHADEFEEITFMLPHELRQMLGH